MNRRDFSKLVPALLAAPALMDLTAEAQKAPAAPLTTIKSGGYPPGPSYVQQPGRNSNRFVIGMLAAGNIRLESHFTTIEPGTPHEPINKHLHSEIWYVHEGTIDLNTNGQSHILKAGDMGLCAAGDLHFVTNIGKDRASYFVVTVGPPE